MGNNKLVILTESAFFKRGQIVEDYELVEDGMIAEGKFVSDKQYVIIKENLSSADEKRVKELIKQQLRVLFYNLYSKQSFLI